MFREVQKSVSGSCGRAAPSLLKASTATAASRLGVPQSSPRARATTPLMHKGGQETRGLSDCGGFLHPIQPLAHEGLAQHILFDIHKMSGPIEHSEGRSGVVVQQIPGVLVSTEVVLSCGQNERGATKGCGQGVHVKGKGAGCLSWADASVRS